MTYLLATQPNYTTSHLHVPLFKILFFKQNHHFIFEKPLTFKNKNKKFQPPKTRTRDFGLFKFLNIQTIL
jgi:hypothetical protein